MSHGPYISHGVAKCWPEIPITLDVIFAEVKFVTVRVGQLKHAGLLAFFWKTLDVERFPFTRFLARLYPYVVAVS